MARWRCCQSNRNLSLLRMAAFRPNSRHPRETAGRLKADQPLPGKSSTLRYEPLPVIGMPVFRILALVLLVSALVVPRAAWGAHLSGHDDLSSAGAVHSHHGDHSHEDEAIDSDAGEHDDGPVDLTHDHRSALAIAGDIPLPEAAPVGAATATQSTEGITELHLRVLSRPDSLLRPPRAI